MKKSSRQFALYGMHIAVPLLLGLTIYLLFSLESGIPLLLLPLKRFHFAAPGLLPASVSNVLRGYVPDMLWAYALTVSVTGILGNSAKTRRPTFLICTGFCALMEYLQKWMIFPGTFDPMDIVLESLAVIIALFFTKSLS